MLLFGNSVWPSDQKIRRSHHEHEMRTMTPCRQEQLGPRKESVVTKPGNGQIFLCFDLPLHTNVLGV